MGPRLGRSLVPILSDPGFTHAVGVFQRNLSNQLTVRGSDICEHKVAGDKETLVCAFGFFPFGFCAWEIRALTFFRLVCSAPCLR